MRKDDRRELLIKGIMLALCLLLAAAAIVLLVLICWYPWLLLFFGPLSFYALYRLLFGSPKERKQARARRAMRKAQLRQWHRHRFYPVSRRGRAAYLILCLEEALKLYESDDLDRWKWLLRELWQITSTRDIDRWVDRICDAAPETVLGHCKEGRKSIREYGFCYTLTEEEFAPLQALYSQDKPFLSVIFGLYETVLDSVAMDWGDPETDHAPDALSAIDRAEQILTEHDIPAPRDQRALNFIMEHRDGHYGKPFDGAGLSSVL